MSTTLVETFPFPPPHQILPTCVPTQQLVPLVAPLPPSAPYELSGEERWAAQLVHLASQHHASEYNRMKYGPQGCPITYIPLSIQMPDHVRELQTRQAEQAKLEAWWPCGQNQNTNFRSSSSTSAQPPIVLGPCGDPDSSSVDLQEEISAAISSTLPNSPRTPLSNDMCPQVKTSQTHPINISSLIPPELLPMISSRLTFSKRPSPTMFDIPPAYTMDRVTGSQLLPPFLSSPISHSPFTPFPHNTSFPPQVSNTRPALVNIRSRSSVSEALQAAINSGLAAAATAGPVPQLNFNRSMPPPMHLKAYTGQQARINEKLSTFATQGRAYSAPPQSVSQSSKAHFASDGSKVATSQSNSIIPSNNYSQLHLPHSILKGRPTSAPPIPQNTQGQSSQFSLGNLFLSSCPGKKVRLSGPVKGRSSVCRDLETDMRRMKGIGVRCVVCCLDDSELEFLGASWPEYSRAAHDVGLDVLRLPTPEGLAPLSLELLDAHLTRLIDTYTLRGVPILIHCRGGVGRAGVIACCWMLKLGLCGWIETDPRAGLTAMLIRRDTMQLVERVISVVRKRRSVKAVETYEQVKFLVEYVEYLRLSAA